MRTLSSILHRRVETESGEALGRCYDLRGRLTSSSLEVTDLVVGRRGLLERFGVVARSPRGAVSWDAVVRIEGDRIVVKDGTE